VDPHKIVNRWMNYLCQLLNVQWADPQKILTRWKNYFCQQTEIHTAEPFVPEPSAAEVEVAIRRMKRYKAPGSDQIPAELIQAGGKNCILRYINLLR
jgi:hypothetical protein